MVFENQVNNKTNVSVETIKIYIFKIYIFLWKSVEQILTLSDFIQHNIDDGYIDDMFDDVDIPPIWEIMVYIFRFNNFVPF